MKRVVVVVNEDVVPDCYKIKRKYKFSNSNFNLANINLKKSSIELLIISIVRIYFTLTLHSLYTLNFKITSDIQKLFFKLAILEMSKKISK